VFATVQDSIDVFIPAAALDYIQMDSGLLGLMGSITSLMGGFNIWKGFSS
jgi:hypothetical protein